MLFKDLFAEGVIFLFNLFNTLQKICRNLRTALLKCKQVEPRCAANITLRRIK